MKIQLGKHVVCSDGTEVGKIDRLVIDPHRGTLIDIVIHEGILLTHDRLLEPELIDHIDADGTAHLMLTGDEVEALPEFIEEEYIVPDDLEAFMGSYDSLGLMWPAFHEAEQYGSYANEQDTFEVPPTLAPIVEVHTNTPAESIEVHRGVRVMSADGKKLGTMTMVVVNGNDDVESIIMLTRHLGRHREVEIPQDLIKSMTFDQIILTAPAEEFEQGKVPRA